MRRTKQELIVDLLVWAAVIAFAAGWWAVGTSAARLWELNL